MRKLTAIPLFIIYLIAAVGATFQVHLCHGQFVAINYQLQQDTDGCCDKKEKSSDCCEDIQITIKADSNHFISFSNFQFLTAVILNDDASLYIEPSFVATVADLEISLFPNPPPGLWENIPLFLLHRKHKLDC